MKFLRVQLIIIGYEKTGINSGKGLSVLEPLYLLCSAREGAGAYFLLASILPLNCAHSQKPIFILM